MRDTTLLNGPEKKNEQILKKDILHEIKISSNSISGLTIWLTGETEALFKKAVQIKLQQGDSQKKSLFDCP